MKTIQNNFPKDVYDKVIKVSESGGILTWQQCKLICQQLELTTEELMIKLLPFAASFSKPTVSGFQVGAVLRGEIKDDSGAANLYFGANLEFPQQPLSYSLHAEQSAISNAWVAKESSLTGLAISAPPCGHCRQFLFEAVGSNDFPIFIPTEQQRSNQVEITSLSKLLPLAFGPLDLGGHYFFEHPSFTHHAFEPIEDRADSFVFQAVQQAGLSYVPYTNNYCACVVKTADNTLTSGVSIENAAYNPSITAMASAMSKLALFGSDFSNIERIILVEQVTKITQKEISKTMLASFGIRTELEYFNLACLKN